jgi:hypothetical protein
MPELKRANFHTATDLVACFEPSDEARPLYLEGLPALELVERYLENGCYADAVKCVALLLPNREAVWWACQAYRHGYADTSKEGLAVVESAEQWALQPTEENRLLAESAAQRLGTSDPAAWPAMAAGWSGGSLAPEGEDPVPPPNTLYAHAAAAAVMMAAAADPEKFTTNCERYVRQGIDMACGGTGDI